MSLISAEGALSNFQIGIIIGLAVLCLIILIAIIAVAIGMRGPKNNNNASAQQPQVILMQAPYAPVAPTATTVVAPPAPVSAPVPAETVPMPSETVKPELVDEEEYDNPFDEPETTDEDDIPEVEPEEEESVYDTVAIDDEDEEPLNTVVINDGMKVVDDDAIVFKSVTRKTFDEAYNALSKEQKSFFDNILEYALAKPDAKELRTKSNVKVKSKSSLIVKLLIRRDVVVTSFLIENDMLKIYRKELSKNDGAKINVKSTEVPLIDVSAFDAAKGLIDVAYEQIEHERALQVELRKERRRLAREAKKAEKA